MSSKASSERSHHGSHRVPNPPQARPSRMAIDFLVSENTLDGGDQTSRSPSHSRSSPPIHNFAMQGIPFRQPRPLQLIRDPVPNEDYDFSRPVEVSPHQQPGSVPHSCYYVRTAAPMPLYLEPSAQPYLSQQVPQALRRPRVSSISSASSGSEASSRTRSQRRAARPKYTLEMGHFIWFHRVDLGESWEKVRDAFNQHFTKAPPRDISGIQSKLYRVQIDNGLPKIREQRRARNTARDAYHDIRLTEHLPGVHYDWMDDRLPNIQHIRNYTTLNQTEQV